MKQNLKHKTHCIVGYHNKCTQDGSKRGKEKGHIYEYIYIYTSIYIKKEKKDNDIKT